MAAKQKVFSHILLALKNDVHIYAYYPDQFSGDAVPRERIFTSEEYARRLTEAKRRMRAAGLDLIICQDPANMNWLTGYDGWSFYVPQCVLVHVEEEWPFWFGRAQDRNSARFTTDLPDQNIQPFSERLVQHPSEHPYDELAAFIRGKGWSRARIGVE